MTFSKESLGNYFLEKECPFAKKRTINLKKVTWISCAVAFIGLVVLLSVPTQSVEPKAFSQTVQEGDQNGEKEPAGSISMGGIGGIYDVSPSTSSRSAPSVQRQRDTSQLVNRQGGSGDKLPVGSTFPVRLVNSLISSQSGAPILAEVIKDIYWKGQLLIPLGSRAIGNGSFDPQESRLKARFHTLVYPSGEEHSFSGMGFMPNMSPGLAGEYHSGAFKKQSGRFLGNFIGGFAEGLKDKQANKAQVYSPGSLKNAVLGGVELSAIDQAKLYAEDMKQERPYITVDKGLSFMIYLDQSFGI